MQGALARRMAGALLAAMLSVACGAEGPVGEEGADSMPTVEEMQSELRAFLLRRDALSAEGVARRLGPASGPVLSELGAHDDSEVRRTVLELAGVAPSPEGCRVILRLLEDADPEVRELAALQTRFCSDRGLAQEMIVALERSESPEVQSQVALQLGSVASPEEIPRLRVLRTRTTDAQVRHDLGLALAKLGDASARLELVERLTLGSSAVRVQALNDSLYVGDRALVAEFGPALHDDTDVLALSIPEEPPMTYARVCDVAVFTMVQLGVSLGFPMEMLVRLEDEPLRVAREHVRSRARP